jgi:hypothetical protein
LRRTATTVTRILSGAQCLSEPTSPQDQREVAERVPHAHVPSLSHRVPTYGCCACTLLSYQPCGIWYLVNSTTTPRAIQNGAFFRARAGEHPQGAVVPRPVPAHGALLNRLLYRHNQLGRAQRILPKQEPRVIRTQDRGNARVIPVRLGSIGNRFFRSLHTRESFRTEAYRSRVPPLGARADEPLSDVRLSCRQRLVRRLAECAFVAPT